MREMGQALGGKGLEVFWGLSLVVGDESVLSVTYRLGISDVKT